MNRYKFEFDKYTSAVLIEKRALGDELSDEAHEAIKEIFIDRGEMLPAKPSKPVLIEIEKKGDLALKVVGSIIFFIVMTVVARTVTHSWLLTPVAFLFVGYFLFKYVRKELLPQEKRVSEDIAQVVKDESLSELMLTAANGDSERVKELVAFGADVNARGKSGTTALMYAARNNRTEIVDYLLSKGADLNAQSAKGSSAIILAKKFGHHELSESLKLRGAK